MTLIYQILNGSFAAFIMLGNVIMGYFCRALLTSLKKAFERKIGRLNNTSEHLNFIDRPERKVPENELKHLHNVVRDHQIFIKLVKFMV